MCNEACGHCGRCDDEEKDMPPTCDHCGKALDPDDVDDDNNEDRLCGACCIYKAECARDEAVDRWIDEKIDRDYECWRDELLSRR